MLVLRLSLLRVQKDTSPVDWLTRQTNRSLSEEIWNESPPCACPMTGENPENTMAAAIKASPPNTAFGPFIVS